MKPDLDRVIAFLAGGDRDAFEASVVAFTKRESADVLWSAIGAAHGVSLDLFAALNEWPDAGIRVAMRRLMPAVARVSTLNLGDAVHFLRFAERVPLTFRHTAVEQLQPHINADAQLGVQLGEAQLRADVAGEGAMQVWAGAFAAGAPAGAATYAAKLLTSEGGLADAQLHALLQYLDVNRAEVVAVLQPVEGMLTARLLAGSREPERSYPAWIALTSITAFSGSAADALQCGLENGETSALMATAHWLQRQASVTVGVTAVPVENLAGR